MFCKKCGNQLNEGAAFCPCCGEKVVLTQQAQTSVTPTPVQAAVQPATSSDETRFWKFIWRDGLFLLSYISCLLQIFYGFAGVIGLGFIPILLLVITIVLRRSGIHKPALIFLVVTMASNSIMPIIWFLTTSAAKQ